MMLPEIVSLEAEANTSASYDNHPVAHVNNHVIRVSVMTEPCVWHYHPASDETFLCIEGELEIEFRDGARILKAGQLLTVPQGTPHRTRPVGARSVNLTFEAADCETIAD